MDREDAQRALEVLRKVVSEARDESALQNWGVIWIVHGFVNGAGFVLTDVFFSRGITGVVPYISMWCGVILIDLLFIAAMKPRAGARTFVESQLWAIWLTFIAAIFLLAGLNHALDLPTFALSPVIGLLVAFGFASMGSLMGRVWYGAALIFSGVSVAMAFHPRWQHTILGVAWAVVQIGGGILLLRAKRRRLAAGPAGAARLV